MQLTLQTEVAAADPVTVAHVATLHHHQQQKRACLVNGNSMAFSIWVRVCLYVPQPSVRLSLASTRRHPSGHASVAELLTTKKYTRPALRTIWILSVASFELLAVEEDEQEEEDQEGRGRGRRGRDGVVSSRRGVGSAARDTGGRRERWCSGGADAGARSGQGDSRGSCVGADRGADSACACEAHQRPNRGSDAGHPSASGHGDNRGSCARVCRIDEQTVGEKYRKGSVNRSWTSPPLSCCTPTPPACYARDRQSLP